MIIKLVIRRGWSSKRWRSYWLSSGSAPAMSKSSPTCRGMQKLLWFDNINIFIIITIANIIVIINYGNPSKTTFPFRVGVPAPHSAKLFWAE